jgi:hypothetical protein
MERYAGLIVVACVLLAVFVGGIRAFLIDSYFVYVFLLVVPALVAAATVARRRALRYIPATYWLLFIIMMVALPLLQLLSFGVEASYVNLFNYFFPVTMFFVVTQVFDWRQANRYFSNFFVLLFVIGTAFILVEAVDAYLGFNVHTWRYFEWFIETDNRFRGVTPGVRSGDAVVDVLPLSLGILGFPHYTAPLYVVSLIFTIVKFRPRTVMPNDGTGASWLKTQGPFAALVFVGVVSVYLLGVKTHYITAFFVLALLCWGISKTVCWSTGAAGVVLTVVSMLIPVLRQRAENQIVQVVQGNAVEGSRVEVILNPKEYNSLFELPVHSWITGIGDFDLLSSFAERGYFLEQKILVFAIVLGIPFVLTVLGFLAMALFHCWKTFTTSADLEKQGTTLAVGASLFIYFVEMFHFGGTFASPHFPIVYVLLAIAALLAGGSTDAKQTG